MEACLNRVFDPAIAAAARRIHGRGEVFRQECSERKFIVAGWNHAIWEAGKRYIQEEQLLVGVCVMVHRLRPPVLSSTVRPGRRPVRVGMLLHPEDVGRGEESIDQSSVGRGGSVHWSFSEPNGTPWYFPTDIENGSLSVV
eukprot:scaffold251214_cov36-Tisochrysis_lutea.AAC.2